MFGKFFQIVCAVLLWYQISCTDTTTHTKEIRVKTTQLEKIKKTDVDNVVVSPARIIHYQMIHRDSFNLNDSLDRAIVCALNRVDAAHLSRVDSLILPDLFSADFLYYAPFPIKCDSLKEVPKCIFISYPLQAFAAYEFGKLIRWGPVSLGKQLTPTPTGLFHCNWKSRKAISTINPEWIMEWYINLDNRLGVSMHQYDLPGYPASHACVRLLKQDAIFLYRWTDSWKLKDDWNIWSYGTPVIISGYYTYKTTRPWFKDGEMEQVNRNEFEREVSKYHDILLQRLGLSRDSVPVLP
jgi:hypothetical protein